MSPAKSKSTNESNYIPLILSGLDIDECSMGLDNCRAHSICTNTDGLFNCKCKAGFSGNGHVRCVSKLGIKIVSFCLKWSCLAGCVCLLVG